MRQLLIISLLFAWQSVHAQALLPSSARSESLSNADAAFGEANVLSDNPSLAAHDSLAPLHLLTSYIPEYANIPTASHSSAAISYFSQPSSTSFSLSFSRLSYQEIFSDQTFLIAASHRFDLDSGREASVGLRLRYENVSFTPSYPTVNFFIADFGVQILLTKEFSLGAYTLNLLGSSFTTVSGAKEDMPRTFGIGIAYSPDEMGLSLFTTLRKETNADLQGSFGIEYFPIHSLAMRIGTTSEFTSVSGGVGLKYDFLSFDLGVRFSGELGTTLIFSIGASL